MKNFYWKCNKTEDAVVYVGKIKAVNSIFYIDSSFLLQLLECTVSGVGDLFLFVIHLLKTEMNFFTL